MYLRSWLSHNLTRLLILQILPARVFHHITLALPVLPLLSAQPIDPDYQRATKETFRLAGISINVDITMGAEIVCPGDVPSQYEFLPSVAGSVIFIILFGGLTAGHAWRMTMSRQWFMSAFILGTSMEIAGYGVRIMGHNNPCNENTEITQKILLLVAPSVFAATIYMVLGRTILAVQGAHLSPIKPSILTKVFVTGDIVCFFVQLTGGAIMSGGGSRTNLGRYIILTGLGLQITLFGLFVYVAYLFHTRILKQRTEASHRPAIKWETMLTILYVVSGIIMIRNFFRVAETSGGRDGYLLQHEWPLYVFDSIPMVAVVAILLYWFPTLIRPTKYSRDSIEVQPVLGRRQHSGYKRSPSPEDNSNPV